MDDVYNNIDDYKPERQRKILIVFDDTIADISSVTWGLLGELRPGFSKFLTT